MKFRIIEVRGVKKQKMKKSTKDSITEIIVALSIIALLTGICLLSASDMEPACAEYGCKKSRWNGSIYCMEHEQQYGKKRKKKNSHTQTIKSNTYQNTDNTGNTGEFRRTYDPYDVSDYRDGDDFAEEWAEEFGDGDYDSGYDDAYDYWEENR